MQLCNGGSLRQKRAHNKFSRGTERNPFEISRIIWVIYSPLCAEKQQNWVRDFLKIKRICFTGLTQESIFRKIR